MDRDLRYPIGKFQPPSNIDDSLRATLIDQIAEIPGALRRAVEGLTDRQLDTPYRDGGWTVRQVVHHLPDSHMNAYIRFKLTLTEDQPTSRPYQEAAWAELEEAKNAPIALSLDLLTAVHARWVAAMRTMKREDFDRTFNHPERGVSTLKFYLALYDWHGRHHVAHITSLATREGWVQ